MNSRIAALVCGLLTLVLLLGGGTTALDLSARGQEPQPEAGTEVLANLAAGRVAILVCKDGMVVATAESPVEPGTLPPMIVPLSAFRVGVLLGPLEWIWPGSGRSPLRLDAALRRAGGEAARARNTTIADAASDIETIGLAFLTPLRSAAAQIHSRLRLQQKDVLAELLLAGYAKEYGPEVWSLRYRLEQHLLRGDFYETVVHRPEYIQLYPPEKGQPHTLVETRYPPDDASEPRLLDLLIGGDSRVSALHRGDAPMERAAERVEKGESQKVPFLDGVDLLRASMQAVTPRDRRQMLAAIKENTGVEWLAGEELSAPALPQEKREPGAPSLYKQPKPPRD